MISSSREELRDWSFPCSRQFPVSCWSSYLSFWTVEVNDAQNSCIFQERALLKSFGSCGSLRLTDINKASQPPMVLFSVSIACSSLSAIQVSDIVRALRIWRCRLLPSLGSYFRDVLLANCGARSAPGMDWPSTRDCTVARLCTYCKFMGGYLMVQT